MFFDPFLFVHTPAGNIFKVQWFAECLLNHLTCAVVPKTHKIVLGSAMLNTQHYKVWIKGKVEQSRERSSMLPYTLV